MSREDTFIRVYCEITGASESSARNSFILHDVLADAGSASRADWIFPTRMPAGGGSPAGARMMAEPSAPAREGAGMFRLAARGDLGSGLVVTPVAA